MKVTINPLDQSSIDKAIEELNKYKKKLEKLPEKLAVKMQSEGYIYAQSHLPPIGDQNLPAILERGQRGDSYTIEASGCLPFVEFGTGVVGRAGGYPNTEYIDQAGWDYASGPRVHTTKAGRIGWTYFNEARGHFMFTEGIAPGAFMYGAVQYMVGNYLQWAKEELNSNG